MSRFAAFMKENKKVRENGFYAPTKSLCDENGKPLEWEFRHITSKENEKIRSAATNDVQITGKPNMFRPKLDSSKYAANMAVASVVFPDLMDAELQDSYGVKKPDDLLFALVDDPGEYTDLIAYVQKFQGFNISFEDEVEEAKN